MKSFYIIPNRLKDPELVYTKRIAAYLESKSKACKVVVGNVGNSVDGKNVYTDAKTIPADTECIIVLGGDGTLLMAARDTIDLQIPLIGINLGTVGYLAEIEISQIEVALEQLIHDQYIVEERMMLAGEIKGIETTKGHALNDVVISRVGPLQIIIYDIYVNDCLLYSIQADGIILSTPTGSTGYNMSAGGPIVQPQAQLLVLTAICPHSIHNRSIILAPEDVVRIEIEDRDEEKKPTVDVHFDGKESVSLQGGDSVTIYKSSHTTKILKLHQESFITVLQKKMNES